MFETAAVPEAVEAAPDDFWAVVEDVAALLDELREPAPQPEEPSVSPAVEPSHAAEPSRPEVQPHPAPSAAPSHLDDLTDNGFCPACGYSHLTGDRRRYLARCLPATNPEIREAWPCFYPPGLTGNKRMQRDLHAIGAVFGGSIVWDHLWHVPGDQLPAVYAPGEAMGQLLSPLSHEDGRTSLLNPNGQGDPMQFDDDKRKLKQAQATLARLNKEHAALDLEGCKEATAAALKAVSDSDVAAAIEGTDEARARATEARAVYAAAAELEAERTPRAKTLWQAIGQVAKEVEALDARIKTAAPMARKSFLASKHAATVEALRPLIFTLLAERVSSGGDGFGGNVQGVVGSLLVKELGGPLEVVRGTRALASTLLSEIIQAEPEPANEETEIEADAVEDAQVSQEVAP
ncbi:MAG: hypothetical protein QM765_20985 [Myxococcales bacterium]